jgi:sulfur relay (sulfurtransferase) complex TusBCD TusD component (DsrE family)
LYKGIPDSGEGVEFVQSLLQALLMRLGAHLRLCKLCSERRVVALEVERALSCRTLLPLQV